MSRRRQTGRFAHRHWVWLRERPERRPRARNLLHASAVLIVWST
jgi:hypothetical protein